MSKNLALATRRLLAGGLAAAALTAGLGLAGSGIAEAAPQHSFTCLTNVHGSTTINDHGATSTLGVAIPQQKDCIFLNNGRPDAQAQIGVAAVNDPRRAGYHSETTPETYLSGMQADGSLTVRLIGKIHNGPGTASQNSVTAEFPVQLTLKPGKNYVMENVTIDAAGRVADTKLYFDVTSPTNN